MTRNSSDQQNFNYKAAAFYKFVSISKSDHASIVQFLCEKAQEYCVKGLIILAEEGVNGTVAGLDQNVDRFLEQLKSFAWANPLEIKFSPSDFQPFKRFKVDLRSEIVTSKNLDLVVSGKNNHLSPAKWHQWLNSENPPLLMDTRNDYESKIGTFKGAIAPPIKEFHEFATYLENSGLPKEQPMLMFCTGGIRCEKAILEARRLGYNNTYQLEGGILKYLEEYPEGAFEGECFVFDNRVSVDSKLQPSRRYKLCPHCGEPGELKITCGHCNTETNCCEKCSHKKACSKNCAYHLGLYKSHYKNKNKTKQENQLSE